MKKLIAICVATFSVCGAYTAFGAANMLVPKKASSVAKHEETSSVTNVGGSLLPTALGLVGNVVQLTQQQKELKAGCEPTAKEVNFVNNLVKEWAIAGASNPFDNGTFGAILPCDSTAGYSYRDTVVVADTGVGVDNTLLCYDVYTDADARGAVWVNFPKAAVVTYCPDNSYSCSKNKQKTVTNLYTIFDAIDFTEQDYTRTEASQAQALLQKAANCSGSQLAAKRLESFGGFIKNTIGNMGQKTNTGSVMDAVSGVVGNAGIGGMLGSFGSVATQLLDK
ncbi:MAG: hypothetical protein J5742_00025 [Alphaproteobacteria bacterium]|nr:hypothetical protein [Alphaproteobacteria bacterium]